MQTTTQHTNVNLYSRSVEVSKRVRWEIDRDVIRGRDLDFSKKFLPDGLSGVRDLAFLSAREQRLASQSRVVPTRACSGWSSASSA